MSQPCLDLVSFADGELDPARAEAFRSHLLTCDACRAGLIEAMQLTARLESLSPEPGSPEQRPTPRRDALLRTATRWWLGGGGVAIAAAAALLLWFRTGAVSPPDDTFTAARTRPREIRLAYAGASKHLPTRDEPRGTSGPATEIIPLARLEQRKDAHGLIVAKIWSGDYDLNRALEQLRQVPPTPALRSDIAAIESITASEDNLEGALAELEALRSSADRATSRAARWNHALVLTRLGLWHSAAREFRAIADDAEAGWSDEARGRADDLENRAKTMRASWYQAHRAGSDLAGISTAVLTDRVRRLPGLLRAYFYDAVRKAPDVDALQALTPMAAQLDQLDDRPILTAYVQRIIHGGFPRRAPLAAAYARSLQGRASAEDSAALTQLAPPDAVVDIVIGAMTTRGVAADHLDAYRAMVQRMGDPWLEVRLAREEAKVAIARSDWFAAEAALLDAQKLCSIAIDYQCLWRERELAELYGIELRRIPEALTILRHVGNKARDLGEFGLYLNTLFWLAETERFHSSIAMSRAYAGELDLAAPETEEGNESRRAAHKILADLALRDLDGRAARRELDLALRGAAPTLPEANIFTDIARLDPQPGDLAQLQGWLRTLRATETSPASRALADEIEGRLLVESDRPAGAELLERAIAATDQLPTDVLARRVRAGAYDTLAFDAARQGDHAHLMALIARLLKLPAPGACTVGMVAEDERGAVVVRGRDGRDVGEYVRRRRWQDGPLVVPPALATALQGCAHVRVLVNAVLQGQPGVLPSTLAWSYAEAGHGDAQRSAPPASVPRALIVTGVAPPASLGLPALAPRAADPTPSTLTLGGLAATPRRVRAEMTSASEIQFHTHALVDAGVSDASHLVLSSDSDGRYALTAEMIRKTELRGRPLVVLAACRSAQGARYQDTPWSLPDAFLAAGARAVFAVATEVPDREAGPFFDRVLAQIRAGSEPASALHDQRLAALAVNQSSWAASVILFE